MTVSPLAQRIQGLILETFEIPEQEALSYALSLTALAEGWGTPESAAQINWSYRVKKHLGRKGVRWRSEAERMRFEEDLRDAHRAYEFLISRP